MHIWFLIAALGMIAIVPVHFWSVERVRLEERYGKENGLKIGKILGLISGWGFFIFWIGIWVSPQPGFDVPILWNPSFFVPIVDFSIKR